MNWIKNITFLLLGTIIGFIISKNQAFVIVLKKINWESLTFWFSLFLGATIPIIVNYFFIKKQEVIKLKAKLAQDKIDILREYKTFEVFMRTTVILEKEVSDLEFDYESTNQDASIPVLRGLSILENHKTYSKWKLNNMIYIEKLNRLGSHEIANYIWYMLHYIFNLDVLIKDIPDDKMWNVSVAVKNDFINISNEFAPIIDKYLNYTLYRFKNDQMKKEEFSQKEIADKLNKTNLAKYKNQLSNLKKEF